MKALRALRRDIKLTARLIGGGAGRSRIRGYGRLVEDCAKDDTVDEEPLLSAIIRAAAALIDSSVKGGRLSDTTLARDGLYVLSRGAVLGAVCWLLVARSTGF